MSYSWDNDTGRRSSGMRSGGHSFNSARGSYGPSRSRSSPSSTRSYSTSSASSAYTARSYSTFASTGPATPSRISSNAKNIIMCRFDVTGSNMANANIFFEKLPLLFTEAQRYLPELAISFGANGDAHSDSYPLQVCDFASGPDLDTKLTSIYAEGGGGGQQQETYELNAYYDLHNCDLPNAVNPFWFMLCDEAFYPEVSSDHICRHIGATVQNSISSRSVFAGIMEKYNTYILRCKYTNGHGESWIHDQWIDMFGKDRVILLEEPARVVDVMLGLIAIDTGHEDDYSKRLSSRQTSAQVRSVTKSLSSRSVTAKSSSSGKSVCNSTSSKSLKSKKLI